MSGLAERRLYCCTPNRADLASFVGKIIDGGVDLIQLRAKDLEARALLEAAARCQAVCADRGVPFIMNDRPDLALELGADGVHVGQDDAPVALCRRILGPDAIVGLSTHASAELAEALAEDVTYLSAGPVVATPTKPGRPGTGTGYVTSAVRASPWPVWVTGGVDPDSVGELVDAGASHFVVVRWLVDAEDPEAAARLLRGRIDALLEDRAG